MPLFRKRNTKQNKPELNHMVPETISEQMITKPQKQYQKQMITNPKQ
jgi:hypothetical protein